MSRDGEEAFLLPKGRSAKTRVDKSALVFGELLRVRDPAYLRSANGRPCSVPGCHQPAACAAHIRTGLRGGTGLKPSDDEVEWLCHQHHMDQEAHPGPEWWFEHVYVPMRKAAYQAWKVARTGAKSASRLDQ